MISPAPLVKPHFSALFLVLIDPIQEKFEPSLLSNIPNRMTINSGPRVTTQNFLDMFLVDSTENFLMFLPHLINTVPCLSVFSLCSNTHLHPNLGFGDPLVGMVTVNPPPVSPWRLR